MLDGVYSLSKKAARKDVLHRSITLGMHNLDQWDVCVGGGGQRNPGTCICS